MSESLIKVQTHPELSGAWVVEHMDGAEGEGTAVLAVAQTIFVNCDPEARARAYADWLAT